MLRNSFLIVLALIATFATAQQVLPRHTIQLGIGDPITFCASISPHRSKLITNGIQYGAPISTGHIYVQYFYNVNSWLSVGLNVDAVYGQTKNTEYRDSKVVSTWTERNTVFTCMPNIRFNYFNRNIVHLYSAAGIGFSEGFTRSIVRSRNEPGVAFDAVLLGLSLGKEHWRGCFELGALNSFRDADYILLLGSKIFRLSIEYNF